jgi:hypothetical protein
MIRRFRDELSPTIILSIVRETTPSERMEYITVSGGKAIALIATMIPSTISSTIPSGSGVYLWRICVIIPVPPVEEFP